MKRTARPLLLRATEKHWVSTETTDFIKTDVNTTLYPEKFFKVSHTGDLHPFGSEDFTLKSEHGLEDPSVEVHFNTIEEAEAAGIIPIYEVVVNAGIEEEGGHQPSEEEEDLKVEEEEVCEELNLYQPTSCEFLGLPEYDGDLCRVCAGYSNQLVPIFGEEGMQRELLDKIHQHLPITVTEEDELPLQVCESCVAKLTSCHELVQCCADADARLRIMLADEERQHNQQIIDLCLPKTSNVEEEEVVCTLEQSLDDANTSWDTLTTATPLLPPPSVEVSLPIPPTNHGASRTRGGQLSLGTLKKPKFKVMVVKLNNTGKSMSQEDQIAKALEVIKGGDPTKQLIRKQDLLNDGSDDQLWEGEEGSHADWSTQALVCSKCSATLIGAESFLSHQRDMHAQQLYHCAWCNAFCETEEELRIHRQHIHGHELRDDVEITSVAEIRLVNSHKSTANANNICMKVSKEFDKMDLSLKSKIVGAIQDIVLQDQMFKFQCGVCKEGFTSKENLNKHRREMQHRVICCTVCRETFNSTTELRNHQLVSHDDKKTFICNYCHIRFFTKRLLMKHIVEHSEYKAFTCDVCGRGFNSKSGFEVHRSTHMTEKPYLCDLCGKSFKHVSNLKGHKRSHMAEEDKKKQACPLCNKKFRCQFLVQEHMRLHTGERPYECQECPKKFYKRQQLKQHLLVHSSVKYECHICGSCFNRRGNMMEHIKKHMKNRRHVCGICDEGFEKVGQVIAHRRSHTSDEIAQSKIIDDASFRDPTNFQCPICNKFLATKLSLSIHLRTHTGEKPFNCEFCGKKFSQKPALTYHRRRHTGERPFSCAFCNEGFLTRNAKAIHERIHTGEKPFTCYICSMGFRCASSLTQHLNVHTDHRPFPCPHCNKKFRRREAMQVHLRIHTGEKPFPCDLCGRAFTQRGDMVKHRRTHSNERPYRCRHCNDLCSSRKELKRHEAAHQIEDAVFIGSESLITSFPEITIVGQDCESLILEEVGAHDIDDELQC